MEFDLAGKKVLVTGAGKGIGRGTAIALEKVGCKVYALSRTKLSLDSLVTEHPGITAIPADLSHWSETRRLLMTLEPLDGLVNNAAVIGNLTAALDATKEELDTTFGINTLGAINCMQVIGAKMVEAEIAGSIVNVSSVVTAATYRNILPYSVSKACLDMATKQFALELGPHNVRVNSVNPTFTMTDMARAVVEDGFPVYDYFMERTPIPRLAEVGDIVSAIQYLLSDKSAMVTGTTHFVDGGLTCNVTVK